MIARCELLNRGANFTTKSGQTLLSVRLATVKVNPNAFSVANSTIVSSGIDAAYTASITVWLAIFMLQKTGSLAMRSCSSVSCKVDERF